MIYYVDGFMVGYKGGKSPCSRGGFTVVDENGILIRRHERDFPNFTNNHAEILAIAFGSFVALPGDTIISDSQCAVQWAKVGEVRSRRDLQNIVSFAHQEIRSKRLTLKWEPREGNLAGQYNEKAHRKS